MKEALELHESEFAITYDLDELAPDMARALIAAGELADRFEIDMGELEELNVLISGESYNCPKHNNALADFRAVMEGKADD